ncbi:MAG: LemA family protein [Terriglobia bacterium]
MAAYLLARFRRSLRRAGSQLDKDWSDLEVFIKQRNDNLPLLIQTCRSYMPKNQASLHLVAEARSAQQKAGSIEEKTAAAVTVTHTLERLFLDAGQFNGMRNNTTYVKLQNRLLEIEERIAERREAFNEDAARFNARLGRYPGRLFAGKGKLKPRAPWR